MKKWSQLNIIKVFFIIFIIALIGVMWFNYGKENPIEVESASEIIVPATSSPITTTVEKIIHTTLISNLRCVDGDIQMTLTNILRDPHEVSDFTFLIAGRPNRNPDCVLSYLEPGESTFCKDLSAGIKFRKKVSVTVAYPAHNENQVIDCSVKSSITANIVRDFGEFFARMFGLA